MIHIKILALVAATFFVQVKSQSSCINVCTGSANVLTQLKTCNGCGTDDWACFCRCPQYMDALVSCIQQNCDGNAVENSVVSFCADQGVSLTYSTTSTPSTSGTTGTASATDTTSSSISLTGLPGVVASSASVNPDAFSSTTIVTSDGTSPTTFTSSTLTATDTSDVSAYLASAVPSGAAGSNACFVNTRYSQYTTPTWYSSLPTQVQSYYSSANQLNTAACTLSPAAAAVTGSHHSGLSAGAIAGIVIGSILAALLLLLLLLCCLRRRKRSRRDAAAANTRSRGVEPHSASMVQARQAPYSNEKGPIGGTSAYGAPMGGAYGNHERGAPVGTVAPMSGGGPMGGAGYGGNDRGGLGPSAAHTPSSVPIGGATRGGLGGMGGTNGINGLGGMNDGMSGIGGGALGGAAVVGNGNNDPYSHTTTTTTRVTIRPRPKNPGSVSPPSQPSRPAPQPIPNQGPGNYDNSPQITSQRSAERRMF